LTGTLKNYNLIKIILAVFNKKEKKMGEKIGVIHYNTGDKNLEEFLSWSNRNDIGYVELQRKDVWNEEIKTDMVGKLLNKYKIKISQISCGNDFLQKTNEDFEKQVKIVEKMCDIVKNLGFDHLRIDGGWPKEGVEEKNYKNLVMEGVKRVVEIAEKKGVYLALDNHGTVTNNYLLQLEIFENIKSKFLGANLDTMNYRWFGYPVEKLTEIYKAIAPYAIHTHLKDGTGSKENYVGKVLGEGEIPVIEAINILKENGYKGVWCVEYEGKDQNIGYEKCFEFLRNLFK